jgi:enoyl-CoA hydratase/carnithine racemase
VSESSQQSPVLVERVGEYAIVTLNRPEKRNAISTLLASTLRDELARLEDVKVIVVTGAGDRAFSAGMDLSERRKRQAVPGRSDTRRHFWFETLEAVRNHPAVFIAAVNGFAVGGGLTLVNTCELAVASETAQFGMPELGFGAFPSLAGPSTIKRILPKHAAQMILTTKRADAETALKWGIVNFVVPPDQLLAESSALAEHICGFDATVLKVAKKAIGDLPRMAWFDAIDYGLTMSATMPKKDKD